MTPSPYERVVSHRGIEVRPLGVDIIMFTVNDGCVVAQQHVKEDGRWQRYEVRVPVEDIMGMASSSRYRAVVMLGGE